MEHDIRQVDKVSGPTPVGGKRVGMPMGLAIQRLPAHGKFPPAGAGPPRASPTDAPHTLT